MYNWAMAIWNMSADDFVWSSLKWFGVYYAFFIFHTEMQLFRAKRWTRLR